MKAQIAGWLSASILSLLAVSTYQTLDSTIVLMSLFGACCAMVITHGLHVWMRDHDWLSLRVRELVPRLVLACLLVCLLLMGAVCVFGVVILRQVPWQEYREQIPFSFYQTLTVVMLWAGVYLSVQYLRRFRAAEIAGLKREVLQQEVELQSLRAQVNPHFLFNALNSVRALVVENPRLAQDAVTKLSELLRYSLQSNKVDLVELSAEIEMVRDYLAIEEIRFEERLRVSFDIDPAALSAEIPAMLLQILVENAVKHGIAKLPHGGIVAVSGRITVGMLRLEVINSGRLRAAGKTTGIGLENTRQRLRLLYGDRAWLTLNNCGDDLVAATALMPLREAAHERAAG
jgi:sensor histidine kinase YesM